MVKGAYFDTPSGRVWVNISLDLEKACEYEWNRKLG
jgi:hypothetical protein